MDTDVNAIKLMPAMESGHRLSAEEMNTIVNTVKALVYSREDLVQSSGTELGIFFRTDISMAKFSCFKIEPGAGYREVRVAVDEGQGEGYFTCEEEVMAGSSGEAWPIVPGSVRLLRYSGSISATRLAKQSGTSLSFSDDGEGDFFCISESDVMPSVRYFLSLPPKGGGTVVPDNEHRAIVMEPIYQSENITDAVENYSFGKVRIVGKTYPPKLDSDGNVIDPPEYEYDDCCNIYLADTEVSVRGMALTVEGPFSYTNPNYDPNDPSKGPQTKTYYSVVNWSQEWSATLESDLIGGQTITVTVSDIEGEGTYDFIGFNTLIQNEYEMLVAGTNFKLKGTVTVDGVRRLEIIGEIFPVSVFVVR